ncbi:MAG TPA: pyrroloquinoline quinone-dependent dehydrogenase [Bryobacteraceae bacterium]|nr:pyrroloquinoline quinone-dependent dehydrogenase [Bryobacteraceae bacterium]
MGYTFSAWMIRALAGGCLLACAVFPGSAQTGAKNGEWRTYGGDLGNTHYSPLDQINSDNFNKLEIAWRFRTDNLGPRPEFNFESTPLMVHGVIYCTAGTRRDVVALDAATGELLWVHGENEGARGAAAPRQLSGRGLAYWTDGREERILYVTPGYRLIALNAKDGNIARGFGDNGVVDLKADDDQEIDPITGEVGLHASPIVAGDTVIVGAAHRPGGVPRSKTNVKGYVRGFDVHTGKRLWIFHTIPKPGEFGYDTWQDGSALYTGNAGVWGQMSVDPDLGIAYLPVELPTGDYYGGHRPGNGLFGETLVAVDLKTGQRKWHYQLVHHGIWDMDIPDAPMLVDINHNGQLIKAVAQPTKQAFLYVFNRITGEPVFGMQERPVEQSTVPGEKTSPTQPFPVKPPAYDLQGFTVDDLINFTPELHAEALQIVSKYKLGPIFTPPVVSTPGGPYATLALATAGGGTNWAGGSFDPETHIAYIPSQRSLTALGLVPPDPKRSDMRYISGSVAPRSGNRGGPGAGLTVQGLPLVKPPYASISAINLDTGDILWQIAHGETPDNIRNNPALKGVNIPRTGRPGVFGVLVTKTLVISGERGTFTTPSGEKGAMLRAYDKATGQDRGAVYMPAGQTGTPMTYMANGRQYIVLAIAGPGFPAELIAFRLPEESGKAN